MKSKPCPGMTLISSAMYTCISILCHQVGIACFLIGPADKVVVEKCQKKVHAFKSVFLLFKVKLCSWEIHSGLTAPVHISAPAPQQVWCVKTSPAPFPKSAKLAHFSSPARQCKGEHAPSPAIHIIIPLMTPCFTFRAHALMSFLNNAEESCPIIELRARTHTWAVHEFPGQNRSRCLSIMTPLSLWRATVVRLRLIN